jgi:hypothetical protein
VAGVGADINFDFCHRAYWASPIVDFGNPRDQLSTYIYGVSGSDELVAEADGASPERHYSPCGCRLGVYMPKATDQAVCNGRSSIYRFLLTWIVGLVALAILVLDATKHQPMSREIASLRASVRF